MASQQPGEDRVSWPGITRKEVAGCLLELYPPVRHAADKRGSEEAARERLA